MRSIFFSFVAFMTTTTTLLFVGWYIMEIRRSPKCSCWVVNNPVKLIFTVYSSLLRVLGAISKRCLCLYWDLRICLLIEVFNVWKVYALDREFPCLKQDWWVKSSEAFLYKCCILCLSLFTASDESLLSTCLVSWL